MAGHSKWKQIKHKKAATDKKRGKLFSKLARAIIVAAREGGPEPANNFALANAIQKAKDVSMPKENIERAIQRGAGGAESESFEAVSYEGYGPGGAAFVVEALTDNRNRTAANVRAIFTKGGGALGAPGSVAWMFDRKGVILLDGDVDEDELTLAAAEADAEDITDDDGVWQVTCDPSLLAQVRGALEEDGFAIDSAELTLVAKNPTEVDVETARKLLKMVDALEDDDDVQEVHFGFEIPDEALED